MDADAQAAPGVRVVVMAKAAVPGRVKTRLTRPGPGGEPALTPEAAAAVHAAMLDCVLTRARRVAGLWCPAPSLRLAMDDPAGAPASARGWEVVEQGGGPLGERMARVGGGGGAVFLGVDSPDCPHLAAACAAASSPTAAVGPVGDGGYWTLAVPRPMPRLLKGIDWGSERVHAQTHAAARAAGLPLVDLPPWHDVDDAADLAALRGRLAGVDPAAEPELARLREALADPRASSV